MGKTLLYNPKPQSNSAQIIVGLKRPHHWPETEFWPEQISSMSAKSMSNTYEHDNIQAIYKEMYSYLVISSFCCSINNIIDLRYYAVSAFAL